ncbi:MAG TPA: hypothetical protein VFP71_07250 [Candidatus Angelobacter sp.]|nr:hypothetical protein [Candidatus Angelobacter sp.]
MSIKAAIGLAKIIFRSDRLISHSELPDFRSQCTLPNMGNPRDEVGELTSLMPLGELLLAKNSPETGLSKKLANPHQNHSQKAKEQGFCPCPLESLKTKQSGIAQHTLACLRILPLFLV